MTKYVQCQLDVDNYFKLREYATLHSLSLSQTIQCAIKEFIQNKENVKNVNKEIIPN